GDTVEDAFDKVETFLWKLVPPKAPLISTRTLSIPNLWSAKELTSGTTRNNITVDLQPLGTVSDYFSDGGIGTLSATIDGNALQSVAMSTNTSQSGTYSNAVGTLVLTEVGWPLAPA